MLLFFLVLCFGILLCAWLGFISQVSAVGVGFSAIGERSEIEETKQTENASLDMNGLYADPARRCVSLFAAVCHVLRVES